MQEKKVEKIYLGYYPRPWQDFVHKQNQRFKVLNLHRRSGKSVFAVCEIIDKALRCERRNPVYAYVGPTYGAVKRIAWEMIKNYTEKIPGVETNEQDLRVTIPRPHLNDKIKIMLLGAENPHALRGIYLDGCIVDEYAQCDPSLWGQVIRPALSDRMGWAIFCSTPMGTSNHFYSIFRDAEKDPKNWLQFTLKASESNIIPQPELEAAKLTMSEEEYEQEFECSFTAAQIGAYYSKQMNKAETEKRICNVPYDKSVPVNTYFDIGIGDTTAIWFVQNVGKEYHVIDHLETSGVGLEWYVKEIKSRPYIYDEHFLPHDAQARELGTGKTRVETLQGFDLGKIQVAPKLPVDDGIHAVRMVLDNCWFDAVKCKRGVEALKAYERKWDPKGLVFSEKPLHNWASHSADGFRTFAVSVRPDRPTSAKNLPSRAENDWDIFGGN